MTGKVKPPSPKRQNKKEQEETDIINRRKSLKMSDLKKIKMSD